MLKTARIRGAEHIIFEIRDAKGDRAGLEPAAKNWWRKKPRLFLPPAPGATRVAKAATRDLPIVFIHPGDPIRWVWQKPRGVRANLTGVGAFASQTTEADGNLKEILPDCGKFMFLRLHDPFGRENFEIAKRRRESSAWKLLSIGVKSADELKASIGQLESAKNEAIFHMPDDLVESEADFIFYREKKKLPTMFNEDFWAIKGRWPPTALITTRWAGKPPAWWRRS
jgi:ABC-type uncharacterized transport system substrate-binding protein